MTIDTKTAAVLEAISKRGGTATTSTVKSDTYIDVNEEIKYRFRQLRDAGALVIEDQGIDPDTRRRLPLRVELTEDGHRLVEEHDLHSESSDGAREQRPLDERVGTLEEQMDKVRDDMWQLKSDVRGLRDDVERLKELADVPDGSTSEGESGGVFDGAADDPDPNPSGFSFDAE